MNSLTEYKRNRDKTQFLKRKIHRQEDEILRLNKLVDRKESIIRKMAMDHSKQEQELLTEIYKLKNITTKDDKRG